MSADDLLTELQQTFAIGETSGTFELASVQDGAYAALASGLGLPTAIPMTSDAGWQAQSDTGAVTLEATAGTTLLGVSGPQVAVRFTPAATAYTLVIDILLPSGWTFPQSFTQLTTPIVGALALDPDPSHCSALIIASGSAVDPVLGVSVESGLAFAGWFDPNSSAVTQVRAIVAGGVSELVSGSIGYDASSGAVQTLLGLWSGSLSLGAVSADVEVALCAAADPADPAATVSGIQLGLVLAFGSASAPTASVTLHALVTGTESSTPVLFTLLGGTAFPTADALDSTFGGSNGILAAIPGPLQSGELLQVSDLAFAVAPTDGQVQSANLAVTILAGQSWNAIPGALEIGDLVFSFSFTDPFGPTSAHDFSMSGAIASLGVPLTVTGVLPAETLTVALDPGQPTPSLATLVEGVFGFDAGLPAELVITALNWTADLSKQSYAAAVTVSDWPIDIGGTTVTLKTVAAQLNYSDAVTGSLSAALSIGSSAFTLSYDVVKDATTLHGSWDGTSAPLSLAGIAQAFGIADAPTAPDDLNLTFSSASFDVDFTKPMFDFAVTVDSYGEAVIVVGASEAGGVALVLGLTLSDAPTVNLTDIAVVGNLVPKGADTITLSDLTVVAATPQLPAAPLPAAVTAVVGTPAAGFSLSGAVTVGTLVEAKKFAVGFGGAGSTPGGRTEGGSGGDSGGAHGAQDVAPAATPAPGASWIDVQRAFGPVQFQRIGFMVGRGGTLAVLLDASAELAGLSLSFTGLQADVPLSAGASLGFDLDGLDVNFSGGGVTIAGGLQKLPAEPGASPVYNGDLKVQFAAFGLSAVGSYTTVNGQPSLFAFLVLEAPLGGPPFLFITGLAGGFGYNRSLELPDISHVADFPLVEAALGGFASTEAAQSALSGVSPVQANEDWLAAGIRFTSFEMVDSFALLTVAFGTHTEIALLGRSAISVPTPAIGEEPTDDAPPPVAKAVMMLLVDVDPSAGQLAVGAQLTSDSYVLDPAAHLSGGFAFYVWYAPSPHAGDFVISLGGYNPYFAVPSHYPQQIPRLGLSWQVDRRLSISGGLYFALTPAVIMAGGYLKATWQSGGLSAWFDAEADFLIRFKPFSYLVQVSIALGASFTIHLIVTKRITIHVGVKLSLYGPPFGGKAIVDLSIISFTIAFGASHQPQPELSWVQFRQSFLPPANAAERAGTPSAPNPGVPTQTDSLLTVAATRGLLSAGTAAEPALFVISRSGAVITVSTQLPSTTASAPGPLRASWTEQLGIGPMGAAGGLGSALTVTVDGGTSWVAEAITGAVPAGLYGDGTAALPAGGSGTIAGALIGIGLTPSPSAADHTASVPIATLLAESAETRGWQWPAAAAPDSDTFDQGTAMSQLQDTIAAESIAAARTAILVGLQQQGLSVAGGVELAGFAAGAPDLLSAAPQLRLLGEDQPTNPTGSMS